MSDTLSSYGGSNGASAAPPKSYGEIFDEMFPYYLSIGMTADEYWNGDCQNIKAYRKAEKLRAERKNQELWLQGAYIYEALCRVSPVFHAFAKKGTKPSPYPSEPYAINEAQQERKQENADKKVMDKGKAFMETFMVQHNKKFNK